jgi:hypothetical protein
MLDCTDDLRYISHIRNKNKQAYAFKFREYLWHRIPEPDSKSFNISYMAAQAVRLELHRILDTDNE